MTVTVRIALRYLAMLLMARGWLSAQEATSLQGDAELMGLLEAGVGALIGAATEVWTVLARKMGWRT